MAVLKCKMCGGDINIGENSTVAECEYCGSKQTVPTVDDEKKLTLFARANRLRFANEFDKAYGIYESIVADFPEEAEAYWGLILCKYGIEYVDDPATAKKIPTCHRSSFDSVMDDNNFEMVMECADSIAKRVYREEAKVIEALRKSIIEVSGKEEPYDIFICYKETDDSGSRTVDSVIAQDVYDALNDKGYRVFFSRITLEDKLGQEYEPYIFAALNSAKVMLAFGTDYEYYNAVWVKNEWSRFLQLMAKDKTKYLIPCFKGIDAYDMPKEFAKLQSQDMGKVGAIQDLLRGIEKLMGNKAEEATTIVQQTVVQSGNSNAKALHKRGIMALEDDEWNKAADFFDQILNIDAEYAEAYLGKLMAEMQIKTIDELANLEKSQYEDRKDYIKVKRFAKVELLQKLDDIERKSEEVTTDRLEREQLEKEQNALRLKPIRDRLAAFIKLISAGEDHTVGLKSNGTVVATKYTGKNYFDQCDVNGWSDIVSVSTGIDYTIGLKSDGMVVAVGDNACVSCDFNGWTDIVAISAGCLHTVGLKSNGTVLAVGYDNSGRCDVDGWKDIVAISAGSGHTVGLKSDGTVIATKYTGEDYYGQCDVDEWRDIVAVSAGGLHTVGLKSDGTVVAVGVNDCGQCDVYRWKDIVAISAGMQHTVGLKSDGTVVTVGDNYYGQCEVDDWKNIVAISAGSEHTVGLKSDGTVVATEYTSERQFYNGQCDVEDWRLFNSFNNYEQERQEAVKALLEKRRQEAEEKECRRKKEEQNKLHLKTIRDRLTGFSKLISAGNKHTVGLKSNATVVATQYTGVQNDYYGQCNVKGWTNIVAISAGSGHTVGLKSDGTVVATKRPPIFYSGECDVEGWKDIVAVSAGHRHTVGLKSDGTVVATKYTGNKEYCCGQCGVYRWTDIIAISAGGLQTAGLKSDGTVIATVYTGDHGLIYERCDVDGWTDIVAISSGHNHIVGLKSDGTVVAVGSNFYNQCEVNGWKDIVAVSAGSYHTVGLKSDGTVVATKYTRNFYSGECDVDGWTNIVAISAGSSHTVGLKSDGSIVATKYTGYREENYGQCNVYGWKLYNSFNSYEQECQKAKQITALQAEKSKLGFFNGKRKKEIDNQIALREEELRKL